MTAAGTTALIAEARAWASKAVLVGRNVLRDLDRGVAYARRLADALEATLGDMHARELHHFETEQAITEAIAMCDKALAVKVVGSTEADAAAAGTAAAIRDILAPALSDEHAKTLKRAQAEAWEDARRSVRTLPHWYNTDDRYGEFDLQPLGPDETSEAGAFMAVMGVLNANPYIESEVPDV